MYEVGTEVEQVYFPHHGMFSLLAVMRDGKAIETATVGREGVIGAMAGLGLYKSLVRVNVQLPMMASRISSAAFRRSVTSSQALRDFRIGYNRVISLRRSKQIAFREEQTSNGSRNPQIRSRMTETSQPLCLML